MAYKQENITEAQFEVYRLIIEHVERSGFQPSYQELADSLGISKPSLVDRLRQLERKGYITMSGDRERAVVLHDIQFEGKSRD